jgi:hypothetical protein
MFWSRPRKPLLYHDLQGGVLSYAMTCNRRGAQQPHRPPHHTKFKNTRTAKKKNNSSPLAAGKDYRGRRAAATADASAAPQCEAEEGP